jgi:hypothetical protein
VSLGVFLEPLFVVYEVILLQFISFVFICLHFYFETQAKYFAWDILVVLLLLVFVSCF